jgi:hypothetical protein
MTEKDQSGSNVSGHLGRDQLFSQFSVDRVVHKIGRKTEVYVEHGSSCDSFILLFVLPILMW